MYLRVEDDPGTIQLFILFEIFCEKREGKKRRSRLVLGHLHTGFKMSLSVSRVIGTVNGNGFRLDAWMTTVVGNYLFHAFPGARSYITYKSYFPGLDCLATASTQWEICESIRERFRLYFLEPSSI